jgi:hypothetical protein
MQSCMRFKLEDVLTQRTIGTALCSINHTIASGDSFDKGSARFICQRNGVAQAVQIAQEDSGATFYNLGHGFELVPFATVSFSKTPQFGSDTRLTPLGVFMFKVFGIADFALEGISQNNVLTTLYPDMRNVQLSSLVMSFSGRESRQLYDLKVIEADRGSCN